MSVLYEERPIAALVFTGLFFVLVLTLLANLILSLITGAADEARAETVALDYIANTANFLGMPIFSGPLFESWLFWCVDRSTVKEKLRCVLPGGSMAPQKNPFPITSNGRFGLPSETLSWLPLFGCSLVSEVLEMMDFDQLPAKLVTSTVVFVAAEVRRFEKKHKVRSLDDDALEHRLRLEMADESELAPIFQNSLLAATITSGNGLDVSQVLNVDTFESRCFEPEEDGEEEAGDAEEGSGTR